MLMFRVNYRCLQKMMVAHFSQQNDQLSSSLLSFFLSKKKMILKSNKQESLVAKQSTLKLSNVFNLVFFKDNKMEQVHLSFSRFYVQEKIKPKISSLIKNMPSCKEIFGWDSKSTHCLSSKSQLNNVLCISLQLCCIRKG